MVTWKEPVSLRRQAKDIQPTSTPGHRLMFVGFAFLSFSIFAPTILLPILREHADLLEEEQRLKDQVRALEARIDNQAALGEAFATDVTLNERLAVLDLNYHNPQEETLPVLHDPDAAEISQRPNDPRPDRMSLVPAHWPEPLLKAERWVDANGLIALFLDPTLRPVFLLMSGGLIIAAFVLFAPTAASRKRRTGGAAVRPARSV